MKLIILCGGLGTRFDSIYPKPLNNCKGVPVIHWMLNSIKNLHIDIFIFYNSLLDRYNFKQYIQHLFPSYNIHFITINFNTRGPCETLYLGLKQCIEQKMLSQDDSLLVLDNDNIYNINPSILIEYNGHNFMLYQDEPNIGSERFCYILLKQNKNQKREKIIEIKEKKRISSSIGIGCYGLKSVDQTLLLCKQIIKEQKDETFLSLLFSQMLINNEDIYAIKEPNIFSIGTPEDIIIHSSKLYKPLKFVFDLDNTICTYTTVANYDLSRNIFVRDYSKVKCISHIVDYIHYLKSLGHYIIIHTARNMESCNSNVGKVMKNIGYTTLEWLNNNKIPYDEIYFGKPIGDIYIDDKAYNTYDIQLYQQLGFYDYQEQGSQFRNNKYNKIVRLDRTKIRKWSNNIEGESFFYQFIHNTKYSSYFPVIYSISKNYIDMEYIQGTPVHKLYLEELLNINILDQMLNFLQELHLSSDNDTIHVTNTDLENHYLNKFYERSHHKEHYPFEDFDQIKNLISKNIQELFKSDSKIVNIVNIIHGDFWFSNMILYKGNLKFVDPRGKINSKYTTKGHPIYDYSKIYQSILGLDCLIETGEDVSQDIKNRFEHRFFEFLETIYPNDNIKKLIKITTSYLIFNTFHSYDNTIAITTKIKIWNLVKLLIQH